MSGGTAPSTHRLIVALIEISSCIDRNLPIWRCGRFRRNARSGILLVAPFRLENGRLSDGRPPASHGLLAGQNFFTTEVTGGHRGRQEIQREGTARMQSVVICSSLCRKCSCARLHPKSDCRSHSSNCRLKQSSCRAEQHTETQCRHQHGETPDRREKHTSRS